VCVCVCGGGGCLWGFVGRENFFEWHFTIRGPPGSDFEGGRYHGRITLPNDYPMKPPSIMMLTVRIRSLRLMWADGSRDEVMVVGACWALLPLFGFMILCTIAMNMNHPKPPCYALGWWSVMDSLIIQPGFLFATPCPYAHMPLPQSSLHCRPR